MNKKKAIQNIFEGIYPLSSNSMNELLALIRFETIEKGTTFIKLNNKNESEYFLIDGVCRSYLVNTEGEEISISFYQENSVLSPHIARTFGGFSNQNFQALTQLEIGVFDAEKFMGLMVENLEIRNFANTVLQNELIRKVEKEIRNASLSAKERLLAFRKQHKILENLIPHPYIASYLGITNISLSRLRSDLAKQ